MRSCLVNICIGERPWVKWTRPNMEAYAKRIGAEYVFIDSYDIPDKFDGIEIGRNNTAYLVKLLVINDLLQEYDRVVLLDDSCIVSDTCPNLLQMVPYDFIAGSNEGTLPWVGVGIAHAKHPIGVSLDLAPYDHINTGILVLSKAHATMFTHENIIANKGLLVSAWPDQSFINILMNTYNFQTMYLEERFNRMYLVTGNLHNYDRETFFKITDPSVWVMPNMKYLMNPRRKAFIYHIVSGNSHEMRMHILKSLYEQFKEE